MRKKLLSFLLAIILCAAMAAPAFAASEEAEMAAGALYRYGLIQGIGAKADGTRDFDLDRGLTRAEAVTMLIRITGVEGFALLREWDAPFTDVDDWAKPYVGYAYATGLTKGISDTLFGSNEFVTPTQYLTFMLRALKYESEVDFKWDEAWELTDELGITNGQYGADTQFTRGDMAIVSWNTLNTDLKDSDAMLLDVTWLLIKAMRSLENDYKNEKLGIKAILPDTWKLIEDDELDSIVSTYEINPTTFFEIDAKPEYSSFVQMGTTNGTIILITSITLPEEDIERITPETIREKYNTLPERTILEDVTICGQIYAAHHISVSDQYFYLSVFNGELVYIMIDRNGGDSIDTILGYFE